jgi:hypothetical protein
MGSLLTVGRMYCSSNLCHSFIAVPPIAVSINSSRR